MRYFQAEDLKPGLEIHALSRRTTYTVDAVEGDEVSYTSIRGNEPPYKNKMKRETFVTGMEECFAVIAGAEAKEVQR